MNHRILALCGALCCASLVCSRADAQLTFSLSWGWQGDARQDAAWWALNSVVNRYNAYGDFTGGNGSHVQGAYNPGVPTAQAGYGGWGGIIEYGGTWPNERVTMHELDHWLGTGTYSNGLGLGWDGPRAVRIIEQFEGVGARVGTDGVHFWPYGLNYDNEWSELNARRNVALVYALRADWGIGSTANPTAWNARNVSLAASDPAGTSGFNQYSSWTDGEFAHPNADYSTGAHDLRTPNGYPSWTFAGRSLTINPGGRLLYNGWGHDGRVTITNLTVDNATVRHDQYDLDTFRLAGSATLAGNATFDAGQGDIFVEAVLSGDGSLIKTGAHDLTLQALSDYTGATTINRGTLRLAPTKLVAEYTFDEVRGGSVINGGSGGAAMNGLLANGATIVPAGGGRTGNAVSLANGASVNINNGVTDLAPDGHWAVSSWVKTSTAGGALLSKTNGGWEYGNTAFFLGDGLGAGSGGQPAGVRWAGGFLHSRPRGPTVTDDQWRQVTYVNNGGTYTIYIDGQPFAATSTDSGFSNADIGSLVQLGIANNPGDGAVNFDGLLDSVQVYGQSLSAAQVGALYQGRRLGSLPTTTAVTISSGAAFDLNGVAQEIAGLEGPAGSSVRLGAGGQLIVNSVDDSTFAGVISGGGGLTKSGDGALTLGGANTYNGPTTVSGGVLEVDGVIGRASVEAGATLRGRGRVNGDLQLASGATLGVGSEGTLGATQLTVGGDLNLAGGSTLAITVAAVPDLVAVAGAALLEGVLAVTLDPGYAPDLNQTFTVLTAATLTNNLTLGGPDGSLFSLAGVAANEVVLTAVSGLDGDYNNDGVVDAADYTVWRDNRGAPEGALLNDFNGGSIGAAQYAAWRSNFGAGLSPALAATGARAPEPAATAALAAALIAFQLRRRRGGWGPPQSPADC